MFKRTRIISVSIAVIAVISLTVLTGCGATDAERQDVSETVTAPIDTESEAPEPEVSEPEVELTIQERLDNAFGTFEPVTTSGTGDGIVTMPSGWALVRAEYTGESNFTIHALDATNAEVDLLVNTIGAYSGTTASLEEAVKSLKIGASGPWTVTILPFSSAPMMQTTDAGRGDSVLAYESETEVWAFTHDGQSNFVVNRMEPGDMNLLINEIGAYTGSIPVTASDGLVFIEADGGWTIDRK